MNNFERTLEDLWTLVDDLRGDNRTPRTLDNRSNPVAYRNAGNELARLLPPRPKKYEIVTWYEAWEGLESGIYRRGQSVLCPKIWATWDGLTLVYANGTTLRGPWDVTASDFSDWRVELA